MYLSGTSEVLGLLSADRTGEPGIITFPEWQGITLHAAPTQAGGASLGWLSQLLGQPAPALAATAAPIHARTPLFLPHLQGERAPLWDAHARGAFAGLTSATTAADLTAAVLEGVAFSARLALEAAERSAARIADTLRHGGGGAASDRWCQIRANALGKPLLRMQGNDPGAVGAAVLAGVGSGAMADLSTSARNLVQPDRLFTPDPEARALVDARFDLWQQSYHALRSVSHALAG
jgi:xylulokinase